MNTITMTVELCAEDRARLDSILEQLKQLTPMSVVCDVTPHESTTEQGALLRVACVAERIQEAMTAAGKKQIDLVRETGVDKGALSSYLSGKYEPKMETVAKLARALGVSQMWLAGYDTPSGAPQHENTTEQTAPAKEPEQESTTAPEQESKPQIKLADLQALVQELAAPDSGKRDKVKALVKGYAERVSLIPEDKWPEVYEALTALKKEG